MVCLDLRPNIVRTVGSPTCTVRSGGYDPLLAPTRRLVDAAASGRGCVKTLDVTIDDERRREYRKRGSNLRDFFQ